MKQEVHGNTENLKQTLLSEIAKLYELDTGEDFMSFELIERMAALTGAVGREISVYLSRAGKVADVSVGDAKSVSLPELRLVRNTDRLCGVRCVHTHPNGSGMLSDVDIGTLHAQLLDAMCAIGVREGKPGSFYAAFVNDVESGVPLIYGPLRPYNLPQKILQNAITEADARLRASTVAVAEIAPTRAILCGIENNESYDTLEELAELAKTAGAEVVHVESQRRRPPDNATYIGSGKAEELRFAGQAQRAELFIFDDELSGIQIRNLEQILGAPVIDRTMLILDIFALRATTREGKLQVELAQLKYRLPRLLGQGVILSRQGASCVGMRGPGEKKLEIDRRRIKRRVFELEQELLEVEKQRDLRRAARAKRETLLVALVGYTNSGKSTLLNALSGSDVVAADMLFATLDPVVRQVTLPQGALCLLSDTVGFINKLPHHLVEAFASTLEEVREADLILHVIDVSNPAYGAQLRVVESVLESLNAIDTPRLNLFNKMDKLEVGTPRRSDGIYISAGTGEGIPALQARIEEFLAGRKRRVEFFVP
ncbi:MAG: GTPase HflX, partial [Clostridiales bacterium]|nr:GTPase HflX [Clostridiales bacterium]